MWTMARSDVDSIARPTSHHRKTMMTIFFGIKGIALIDILPEKTKLGSDCFKENMIKEIDLIVYTTGRKPQAIRMCLHFDNCHIHNKRTIAQTMPE
jgi:hypothetical protein